MRSLKVPMGKGFLGPSGAVVPEEDAAEFRFRWPPTVRDRMAVDRAVREEFGGLAEQSRVESEFMTLKTEFLAEVDAAAQRAMAEQFLILSDLDDAAKRGLLDRVAATIRTPAALAFADLTRIRDQCTMLGAWRVLWHDGPPGWADIGAVELEPDAHEAVLRAWLSEPPDPGKSNASAG